MAAALRVDWHLAFRELPIYRSPAVDEALHWQWAQDLAAGRGSPERPFFRAPLYPWWLGLLHGAGLGLAGLRWAGTLLGGASLLLLAGVAARWLGRGPGLVVLALAGLSAAWIYYEPQLLLEHLVLFLLLAATLAWLSLQERPPGAADLGFGLALALAGVTRPNALLLAPVAVVLLWRLPQGRSLRLRRLLWWAGGWLPPLALVAALNGWPASGVLVASQGGVNLWIGNHGGADGWSAVLPEAGHVWERADAAGLAARESGRPLSPGEESAFYTRRALTWMRQHPGEALRLAVRKAALLLAPQEMGNNTSPSVLAARRGWMSALLAVSWWLVLLPGLAGLALGHPRHRPLRIWVASALCVYGGSFLPFFIAGRFRLPLLALLALPAGALAAAAVKALAERRRPGAPPASLLAPSGFGPARRVALAAALILPLLSAWAVAGFIGPARRQAQAGWQDFQLGNAWMRLEEADSARACFRRALDLAPLLPEVRLNLGLLEAARRPALAESLYRAELAVDPRSAKAWNNLGVLHLNLADLTRAVRDFRKALELRPDHAEAAWNLGLAHCRLGLAALARGEGATAAAAREAVLATPYRGTGLQRLEAGLAGRQPSGIPAPPGGRQDP